MEKGMNHTSTVVVDDSNSAASMGSGNLPVFATPALVALMENAAMKVVSPLLEEGNTTVGTMVNISHVKATPLGDTVTATATLEQIDGRRLTFGLTASDSTGTVGEGTHERFIVDSARFMAKLEKK